MHKIKIGTWIETERTLQRGTEYAADYINHRTVPGEYDAFLTYEKVYHDGEWVAVSSKDIIVTIETNITDGKLFSGFGGVNYGHTDVQPGPSKITLNPYAYHARDMVAKGNLVLDPDFWWLADPLDLNFKTYLEQKKVGLSRYFGLDPYWYTTTPAFAKRLAKVVDAINNGEDFRGWDLTDVFTAEKHNLLFWGADNPKLHLTVAGEKLINQFVEVE